MGIISVLIGLYLIISSFGVSIIFNKIESEHKTFGLFLFGILTLPVLYIYEVLTDKVRGNENE